MVKNFDHDRVISLGIRISINKNFNENSDYDYHNFIKDCVKLDSFRKLEDKLTNNINKAKFVNSLLIGSEKYKQKKENNLKGIKSNINKILDMEFSKNMEEKTKAKNKLDIEDETYTQLYIFPENQESHKVILFNNGKLGHGEDMGKWIFSNNRLLLFYRGICIILLEINGLINA
jgi:hypothetical protein